MNLCKIDRLREKLFREIEIKRVSLYLCISNTLCLRECVQVRERVCETESVCMREWVDQRESVCRCVFVSRIFCGSLEMLLMEQVGRAIIENCISDVALTARLRK